MSGTDADAYAGQILDKQALDRILENAGLLRPKPAPAPEPEPTDDK